MRTTRRRGALVLGLIALVVSGCAGEDADLAAGGADTMEAPAAAAPEAPVEADAAALTDPQIAHIAVTANAIDVEMGELAEPRATAPEVREFARTMITDHTSVNERAAALAQRLGVTPEDNPVSQSLRQGADEARERIGGLTGEAFDRAYIDREVEYHQAVLDALDQTLIPGAQNAELRSLLQEVRPAIVAHLEHARSLQSSLGSAQ